eukprot:7064887-Prymnesium_polylepis.1
MHGQFWCLPQIPMLSGSGLPGEDRPRTEEEQLEFNGMLKSVNLLYLGATVLILLDDEYLKRFWTSAEAWLAMQTCTATGLHPAQEPRARCKILLLPGTGEEKRGALIECWAAAPIKDAIARLGDEKIELTNKGDTQVMLDKFERLHEDIRAAWAKWQMSKIVGDNPKLEGVIDGGEEFVIEMSHNAEAAAQAEAVRQAKEAERLAAEAAEAAAQVEAELLVAEAAAQ